MAGNITFKMVIEEFKDSDYETLVFVINNRMDHITKEDTFEVKNNILIVDKKRTKEYYQINKMDTLYVES